MLYWIYDIPNWTLFLLVQAVFIGLSLAGLKLTRPIMSRITHGSDQYNDSINYYFAAVGVLYGLTLGLIAVGTWQNFNDVDSKVSKEASSLGTLYLDLDGYPAPLRTEAENMLRNYVTVVLEKEWPAHQRGEVLDLGDKILEGVENKIMVFEPTRESEKIAHAEVIRGLNELVRDRGYRVQSVSTALPLLLWAVLLVGALINVGMTYLFWLENLELHSLLVTAFASALAILIFLTAAMDNPFRGQYSVSSDPFQYILDHSMLAHGK